MAFLGPYYYGKHTWDNYLLDIQQTIEAANTAQQQNARLQTKALDVAHEQQLGELRQQTDQMRRIEDVLQRGFEELRAEFEWGFTLMIDRMDTQIEQLSQMAERLDAIHKTLQSPLLTQARELFHLGQQHFRKGLLDKALEAYLKAEQKNDVDFPLQLQIGKLFVYGRNEDDNVIDIPQGEKHLLLAARYAEAEKSTFPQWYEYCGQAYFHAAVAAYLIGEQEQAESRLDSMRLCLERALKYLAKAAILWPRFTEILYTQAKCHALLGQIQDAAQKLEVLSDRDRRYFAKASQDGDFKTFRVGVEELFKRATIAPGPLARATQAKLDEVAEAVAWAKRSTPSPKKDLATIESIEQELPNARQSLPTLDVDIEDLSESLSRMRAKLEEIAQRSFEKNINSLQQTIVSFELRKSGCENAMERIKQTMKETSGARMGCSSAAVMVFLVVPVGFGLFFSILPPEARNCQLAVSFILLGDIVGGIVAGVVGSKLWRDHKNQLHQRQLVEIIREIDECVRTLHSLREQAETWKQEMNGFVAWQAQRPSVPPTPRSGSGASHAVT